MAFEENSEGADYLSSLKRSGSPQAASAATAHAPEPLPGGTQVDEVPPSSKASAASAEKRKSPRYRCKGSARLQERGSAVATWATFADISMFGCYVEAASPLRVGTVLGLKLEINGFRVEATGEVRAAYPNLGMGISFIKISEKDREQLRALVASISRQSATLSAQGATRPLTILQSDALSAAANPSAALQAMRSFFENRHVMGRDEFLRILRKNP
jgi:PilZ domain